MDVERLFSLIYEKRRLWDIQEKIAMTEAPRKNSEINEEMNIAGKNAVTSLIKSINLLEKMRKKFALANSASEAVFC